MICVFCISMFGSAQTIKSYAAVGAMGSTGQPLTPPSLAVTVHYYDGYLLWCGVTKYVYRATNADGSKQYVPVNPGHPGLQSIGIVVSQDYTRLSEYTQSTFMGMSVGCVTYWQFIGDGSEPADIYNQAGY